MSAIKLIKIDTLASGVERFQSQLQIGSDTAGFIRENGIIKSWGIGPQGFRFYEFKGEYQIVETMEDMKCQPL